MNELVKNYFEGGLSQADTAALGSLLENDPAAAEAFAERALHEYQATGLPEPRWEERRAFKKPGFWKWPLGLLLAAGAAWAFWPEGGIERPSLELQSGSFSRSSYAIPSDETAERPRRQQPAAASLPPLSDTVPRIVAARQLSDASPATRKGNMLGVVVRQPARGDVSVTVLNASGRELRRLYAGQLEKGEWRFEWDGRLDDGGAAPSGSYGIAVSRGGRQQVKQVTLREKAP